MPKKSSYLDKNGKFKVIYTKIHLKILDRYIRVTLPKTVKKRYKTKYLCFKISLAKEASPLIFDLRE
ncbi:MAG: hypothetical protein KAU90_11030 [Sulfurovaceae bacterium]|nr:hypothetical protein [Sulfurovaceae bacterium]